MVRADGRRKRCIAFPIVGGRIDHHALHGGAAVVAGSAGGGATVAIRNDHAAAIGIEENLGPIETHAVRGIRRPLDAIAVDLACFHARDEYVPVVVCAIVDRVDADRAPGLRINAIEEQQLDSGGML